MTVLFLASITSRQHGNETRMTDGWHTVQPTVPFRVLRPTIWRTHWSRPPDTHRNRHRVRQSDSTSIIILHTIPYHTITGGMYTLLIGYGVILQKFTDVPIETGIIENIHQFRQRRAMTCRFVQFISDRLAPFPVFFFAHTSPRFSITHQYSGLPHPSRNSIPHFA